MNMSSESYRDLISLLEAKGPSGYENEASKYWMQRASQFCNNVFQDAHGNCHAIIFPQEMVCAPKIMVTAHIDEIGFVVRSIDDKGYLRILEIGGWDSQIAQGQRVEIITANGIVNGVIGKKPIHLLKDDDLKKAVELSDLWVDIGASGREDAEEKVCVGDSMVIKAPAINLLNDLVASKACDNRVGSFVILETLRQLSTQKDKLQTNVHFVATVQEEIGLFGARTGAYEANPQAAIIIDATFATDCPDSDEKMTKIECKKGPVLLRGSITNHKFFNFAKNVAKQNNLQYQVEATGGSSSTDMDEIHISRSGIPSLLISVPVRYMHSPIEVVAPSDAQETANFIAKMVLEINSESPFIIPQTLETT